MKHKHYDAIIAWAEGKEVQIKVRNGEWEDFSLVDSPTWWLHAEYRVKPTVKRYRIGLYDSYVIGGKPALFMASDLYADAKNWEKSPNFIRWVTDWIEVEI